MPTADEVFSVYQGVLDCIETSCGIAGGAWWRGLPVFDSNISAGSLQML